jgi:hypothetical protein
VIWAWPEPIPFRLGQKSPRAEWAIDALDRLRQLDLAQPQMPEGNSGPIPVQLVVRARPVLEEFAREMQTRQATAGGLMRSALGKARGLALRLSLVLEMLWWGAHEGMSAPPTVISEKALLGAAKLVDEYFMPMAERVYGDAGTSKADRNAATLAKWIVKEKVTEVHVRHLLRDVRLPGLKTAEDIHNAALVLVEADWLREPPTGAGKRPRMAYPVNPKVLELADGTLG